MRPAPARRRLHRGLLALAVLLGATSCGEDGAATGETPAPVDPGTWSDRFCQAHHTWRSSLDQAGRSAAEAFALPGRDANRAALVALFEATATATDVLGETVQDAGVPHVDGGRRLVDGLVAQIERHHDALDELAQGAAELPVASDADFLAQVADLRDRYRSARDQVAGTVGAFADTPAGEVLGPEVGSRCGVTDR